MPTTATGPVIAALLSLCSAVGAVMLARLFSGFVVGLVGRGWSASGRSPGWLHRPAARRWLGAGFGLAMVVLPRPALATQTEPSSAVMVPLDPSPSSTADPTSAVMVALDPPPPPPPRISEPAPVATSWSVAPGEHLWHIAEQTLGERAGPAAGPVSDAQIADYVDLLVEVNRDVLPDPGNPDLIYPGQVFRLP